MKTLNIDIKKRYVICWTPEKMTAEKCSQLSLADIKNMPDARIGARSFQDLAWDYAQWQVTELNHDHDGEGQYLMIAQ